MPFLNKIVIAGGTMLLPRNDLLNHIRANSQVNMVLEVAILDVKPGMEDDFLQAFSQAQHIIAKMRGYYSHRLKRCLERQGRFILLVEWEKLTDHTEGFRGSKEYLEWKSLLHHFYDPFPTVEHYVAID